MPKPRAFSRTVNMRVSVWVILWLLAQGLVATTLAENGFSVLGDGGADALDAAQRRGQPVRDRLELRFRLDAADQVWVEIEGLRHAGRASDPAPEIFLDDHYLGGLKAVHGSTWRSPHKVALAAGEHVLLLRCADVQDADDITVDRVRVLGGGSTAPRPGAKALRRDDCAHPSAVVADRNKFGKGGIILSVLSGREARTGVLVHLREGEAWSLQVKLPTDSFGRVQAWETELQWPEPDTLRLLFGVNRKFRPGGVDAKHYTPGAWEPLRFSYCGGVLAVDFARAGRLEQALSGKRIGIEIAARDQEIALRPAWAADLKGP